MSDELVEQLRDALCEYAAHQSWRCEHAPHWYMVDSSVVPAGDCPCGLLATFAQLGVDVPVALRTAAQ